MYKENKQRKDMAEIRRQAEEIVWEEKKQFPEDIEAMSVEDIRQMLHELWMHQVQLEIQNQELRLQQEEVDKLRARYFDLYNLAPVGYCTLSERWVIQEVNLAVSSLLGVARSVLVKQPITRFILKEDQDIFYMFSKRLFDSGEFQVCELRMTRNDNQYFWARLEATVAREEQDASVYRIVISDITERKEYEEQLQYLSLRDELTGLYNRAYLENELYRLRKSRDYPITVISMDLDGLKMVNDILGHERGDQQLKACAQILLDSFRSSDIVARLGGDEFVALLPRTALETGEQAVSRIKSRVESYNQEHNEQIPLSLSIGLASAEDRNKELIKVFRQADNLMYRDKLNHTLNSHSQIVKSLMSILEERNFITSGHAHRLGELCLQLGQRMNLSPSQLSNLNLLSQVHDLGKIGVPDDILFKPDTLTDEEWEIMRLHSEKGYRIAKATTDLVRIADLILKHHERWDGKGYPLGISGEDIPIECRILAIADSFDAMTNDRSYWKALPIAEALAEIKKCSGTQFDPYLVEAFLELMQSIYSKTL